MLGGEGPIDQYSCSGRYQYEVCTRTPIVPAKIAYVLVSNAITEIEAEQVEFTARGPIEAHFTEEVREFEG